MNNIIDVIVLVFADGTTYWFKKKTAYKGQEDPNTKHIDYRIKKWCENNREMVKNNPIQNAVCSIRMPEEEFNKVKSNNTIYARTD